MSSEEYKDLEIKKDGPLHEELVPSSIDLNLFPTEVLILILSTVDPLTLKNIPLVCKKWYNLLKADMIWHSIFNLQFPYLTNIFSSVTRSNLYKIELFHRSQLLHNFKRGKLLSQQYTLNHHLIMGRNTVSIDWDRNKLTIIDIPRDVILNCDIRNGKSVKYQTDFLPEGVTCYDSGISLGSLHSSRCLVFGRWDGSVSGALIDHKGLLLSDVHNWKFKNDNGGKIICVCSCINSAVSINSNKLFDVNIPLIRSKNLSSSSTALRSSSSNLLSSHNLLAKSGMIGAFSVDESGLLSGWDVRDGECLFMYQIELDDDDDGNDNADSVIKIQSDGKSTVILITENKKIYQIKNVFQNVKDSNIKVAIEKIADINYNHDFLDNDILNNCFIDYGSKIIVFWNEVELSIYSFNENSEYNHSISYKPLNHLKISIVSFESNDKMFIPQNNSIVGNDPLLCSICFKNGDLEILNIRESLLNEEIKPVNLKTIRPKFLHESDYSPILSQENKCPIASLCLNSYVIAVASYFGKVEIFDLMTGEFLKTVVDKISKRKLSNIEDSLPVQFSNDLIKVYLDEPITRGILIVGSYLQYFYCGNLKDIQDGTKKAKKQSKRNVDKKGNLNEMIKSTIDNYEFEKNQLKKQNDLITKFNGPSHNFNDFDENDQLNMALVMSLSLNENKEEDNDLREAMELSLQNSSTSLPIVDDNDNDHNDDESIDDDLRLAIELSKQENYKNWEEEEAGYNSEEKWEKLV